MEKSEKRKEGKEESATRKLRLLCWGTCGQTCLSVYRLLVSRGDAARRLSNDPQHGLPGGTLTRRHGTARHGTACVFVPQTPAEHLLCVGPSPRLWGYSLSDQTTGLSSWRKADKKQVSRPLCQHRCRGEKYNREREYGRNSGVGVAFYIGWSKKTSLGKLAVRGGGVWVSRS